MPCTASWTWFALVGHWMLNNCSHLAQQNQCCAFTCFLVYLSKSVRHCLWGGKKFFWVHCDCSGLPGNQNLLEPVKQDILLNYKPTFLWKHTKVNLMCRQNWKDCVFQASYREPWVIAAFHLISCIFMYLLNKMPNNRSGKAERLRTGNWFLHRCHSKPIQIQIVHNILDVTL